MIKATAPFERLSLDFKGTVPASSHSCTYLLTIVDEYSRFPFAFPCKDVSTTTVKKCLTQLFSIFGLPSYIHSDRGASFMSSELKLFLTNLGVATSRSTPNHPQGNSQVERYNGTIWTTVCLALEDRGLPMAAWEDVLPDALHSIRSLLCISTNKTPHELFFAYSRKTAAGQSLPTWLTTPGNVLYKKHVRHSKYEPLVETVELLEANPNYAYVRFPNGREDTVSIQDLAPSGRPTGEDGMDGRIEDPDPPPLNITDNPTTTPVKERESINSDIPTELNMPLRRSSRIRKPVDRFAL